MVVVVEEEEEEEVVVMWRSCQVWEIHVWLRRLEGGYIALVEEVVVD